MPRTDAWCKFDRSWTALRGMAFGLSQPVVVGAATVALPEDFDFRPLDDAMAAHVDEPIPETSADTAARRLMLRTLHWAGAVQRRQRIAVSERFHVGAAAEGADGSARFELALPYVDREAASAALNWVRRLVLDYVDHARLPGDDDAGRQLAETLARRLASRGEPGINTFRFFLAADRASIPVTTIARGLQAFGIGRGSRWLYSSLLDTTSAIATTLARDKLTCASVLRDAGIPGPEHVQAADVNEALEAARRFGYPVVVKPRSLDQGAGVAAGLANEEEVRTAFAAARELTDAILVEKHFKGSDYRLIVHDGRVLQVFSRRPGGVTGDGRHTIAELVDIQLGHREMRDRERIFGRRLLGIDDEARELLRRRGLGPDSVPDVGEFVALRRRSNVSTGGLPSPVPLASVHPDNLALATHAAAALRLDFAGIDLIVADIGRSWLETGALICEVNAMPQLSQSGAPAIYLDTLQAILGPRHSVPLWLHVSPEPPPVPQALPEAPGDGAAVGYASALGIWIGGVRWAGPQPDGFTAGSALLRQKSFDAALVHMTPADILRDGLPAARFDRAVFEGGSLVDDAALTRLRPHVAEVVLAPADPLAAARGIVEAWRP
ncbi:MAG: acetate--CoA ligase family protein [Sphingomonadales bacterium]